MKKTEIIMGFPITIEVVDKAVKEKDLDEIFDFFREVDERFSPFKDTSEVSHVDRGGKPKSIEMKEILRLSIEANYKSIGYFNVWNKGKFDPSGIVKGWSIKKAGKILKNKGYRNFYINCGGDILVSGKKKKRKWLVGIKNPFNKNEIIKVLNIEGAIATSGTYERGNHIYDPRTGRNNFNIVSLSVVSDDILESDILATGAFAMGKEGINFLERRKGVEAYMIDSSGTATMTSGFEKFVINDDRSTKLHTR